MFRTDTGYAEDMPDREQFLTSLRAALVHLHEPDRLRQNPLAAAFGTRDRFSSTHRLFNILVDAIAELEPANGELATHSAQDTYEILYYRYVQQMPQSEVADQLGVGVRHLRRKQQQAIESLANVLLARPTLRDRLSKWGSPSEEKRTDSSSVESELAWLVSPEVEHRAEPKAILSDVLGMLQPMAEERNCRLRTRGSDNVPEIATNPIALRQMLLDILGKAINSHPGRQVNIETISAQWAVEIIVSCREKRTDHEQEVSDDSQVLHIASQLALLSGGRLDVSRRRGEHQTKLVLPTFEGSSVLVVDDNSDFMRLIGRYLSGTRYHLVTTPRPEAALSLAAHVQPRIVVMDVMMPGIDGWELLRQFGQHGDVQHIPVIVCTIVGSSDLAHSLGASGYLQKPVTREAFLASLDRLVRETDQAASASS